MNTNTKRYRKNIIIAAIVTLAFIFQSSFPLFAQTDPYRDRDRYDRMGTYNEQWRSAQEAYQSGQKTDDGQSKDANANQTQDDANNETAGANTDEYQESSTEAEYTCEGNTCTAYDDEGRVAARYGYDENGSYYEEYTYNDDGTVASYSKYEYSDPDAAEKYKDSDPDTRRANATRWYERTYHYDDPAHPNRVTSYDEVGRNASRGEYHSTTTFTYDDQGRVTNKTETGTTEYHGNFVHNTTYEYDSDTGKRTASDTGKRTAATIQATWEGGRYAAGSYYEEYTYNDDGTVASYSRYEYSDPDAAEKYKDSDSDTRRANATKWYERTNYSYNESGQVTGYDETGRNASRGEYSSTTTFTYDDQGRVTNKTETGTTEYHGNFVHNTTYEYDSDTGKRTALQQYKQPGKEEDMLQVAMKKIINLMLREENLNIQGMSGTEKMDMTK
jgi:hypothetical protein